MTIVYDELEIQIESRGERIAAQAIRSPFGDLPRVEFTSPVEAGKAADLALAALSRETVGSPPDPEEIGCALYDRLFADGLGLLYGRCRDHAEARGHGLRLRLTFRQDDPRFSDLWDQPWELLCAPGGNFLASDRSTPVVRRLTEARLRRPIQIDPPLRVLVLAVPRLATEPYHSEELEAFEGARERLRDELQTEPDVELYEPSAPTLTALRDALLDQRIHVLYFLGHGGYHEADRFGTVSIRDERGDKHQVVAESLADVFKGLRELCLVVLNGCDTGRASGTLQRFRGVAEAAVERAGVRAVVANRYPVGTDNAILFAHRLLGRLVQGDPVEAALAEARLTLSEPTLFEWATPMLLLGADDGVIFRFTRPPRPSARPLRGGRVRTLEAEPLTKPLRLGIRSLTGLGPEMEEAVDRVLDLRRHFDPETPQGRRILDDRLWHEAVFPELREFLLQARDEVGGRRPLYLDVLAHTSIAFAAGYVLESKSGLAITVEQRVSGGGRLGWRPDDGKTPPPDEPLWIARHDRDLVAGAADRALALAVANPALGDEVETFVTQTGLEVGRLLELEVAPGAGPRSVLGGEHAMKLAQSVIARVRGRRPHEREGALHLFLSAPNALAFYLGQLGRSLGRVVLYEYPFGHEKAYGRYRRSLTLPVEDDPNSALDDW